MRLTRRSVAACSLALLGIPGVRAITRVAKAPKAVLIVVDGLRPDLVTSATMPNLAALRARGVTFTNTHSSLPTVTRVNATVLTTGNFPGHTGIVGNSLYVPAADSVREINTADDRALMRVAKAEGRLIAVKTLSERLREAGLRYAVVTSGSAGASLLLNPFAPVGSGITINATLDSGTRVSWLDSVSNKIVAMYGRAPTEEEMRSTTKHFGPIIQWADRLVRGYLLPSVQPDVFVYWITEPDDSQHARGPGSPQALAGMRESDGAIGRLVSAIDSLGSGTNYIVVSDHGFAQHVEGVNVVNALVKAGLKQSARSNDVVVVSDVQSLHLYVKNRDPQRVRALAEFFEQQPWTAGVFARESGIPGTMPLDALHLDYRPRGADLFVALAWRPDTNAYGVPGLQTIATGGAGGPITSGAAGHGGTSPYAVHSTMILAGPAFQRGVTLASPAGNVDVTPTILQLLQLSTAGTDGRVLSEAFVGGPSVASLRARTDTIVARNGAYQSKMSVTTLGKETYIDQVWR